MFYFTIFHSKSCLLSFIYSLYSLTFSSVTLFILSTYFLTFLGLRVSWNGTTNLAPLWHPQFHLLLTLTPAKTSTYLLFNLSPLYLYSIGDYLWNFKYIRVPILHQYFIKWLFNKIQFLPSTCSFNVLVPFWSAFPDKWPMYVFGKLSESLC